MSRIFMQVWGGDAVPMLELAAAEVLPAAVRICSAVHEDGREENAGAARPAGRASRSPTSRRRRPSSTSTSSRRTSTGLQAYCDEHGLALWPHTKTHKSPEIGLRQLELGAGGLTVAKTGEAQVFRDAGAPRLLVHYPPFGQAKWERLADVAGDVELTVAVDSLYPAEGLAAELQRRGVKADVLVEMDVGLHRTGQTSAAGAVALAQELSKLPALRLVGISCYPGHFHGDFRSDLFAASAVLEEARDAFDAAGLPTDRISGGRRRRAS